MGRNWGGGRAPDRETLIEIPIDMDPSVTLCNVCLTPQELSQQEKDRLPFSTSRAAHLETQQKQHREPGFMHASIKVAMQPIVRVLSATDGLLIPS